MVVLCGAAGFTGKGPMAALEDAHTIGLHAVEVQFTYGVRMKQDITLEFGKKAQELGISLSIHAPYYINLASLEPEKVVASKKRILDSVERGHDMGAEFVVFHPGFYQGRSKEQVYDIIKAELLDLQKTIKTNGWTPKIAAETTGKGSQFGELDELIRLSKETGIAVCIDFAHIKARQIGVIDYDEVCKKVKTIKHVTGHFTGIEWGEKGERNHIMTDPELIKELLFYLKKHDISMRIINESPDPYADAEKTLKIAKAIGAV